MTKKLNFGFTVILTVCTFLAFPNDASSQRLLDRIKRKVEDGLTKKAGDITNDILNGKKSKSTADTDKKNHSKDNDSTVKKRPKLSELRDEDFVQNSINPPADSSKTRFSIANNLYIDIQGKYPVGYQPKWRFISYKSKLKYSREDWLRPKAQLFYEDRELSIGAYNGKAVVRFKPHYDCECFADISIKDVTVLSENPQVFELVNFRKILNERSTGEPCIGGLSNAAKGGWGGKIALSANRNGDLIMNTLMEDYTVPYSKMERLNKSSMNQTEVFYPSQVNFRYTATNISIENEMSAEKVKDIIAKEQEAKQRQKDYISKMKKQSDSLQKIIATKYPGAGCKDCFVRNSNSSLKATPTKTAYKIDDAVYVESGTDWDVNTKTSIKNICNYPLIFVGIQQLYDEERGYYLQEITKRMEPGYSYNSDQGLMSTIFTSFIGGGSEFNFTIQDKYYINYAYVGAVQWLKVVKEK
jgi:hypothetical protein